MSYFCKLFPTIKSFKKFKLCTWFRCSQTFHTFQQTLTLFTFVYLFLPLFIFSYLCLPFLTFVYLCLKYASMHKFCACFFCINQRSFWVLATNGVASWLQCWANIVWMNGVNSMDCLNFVSIGCVPNFRRWIFKNVPLPCPKTAVRAGYIMLCRNNVSTLILMSPIDCLQNSTKKISRA